MKSHPLWQAHTKSHNTRHVKIPPPSGKYMRSLILTRQIKIPPPLASTCTVSSYTSYQNPTPSGKYMHSLILHVISKSHPLWQAHAKSHLTRHIKIPPPLASTCTVSSYTSYQNPTPSGKYMHSLILHVISIPPPLGKHIQSHILRFIWKSHPLWQAHTKSHLTVHMKIPLASTCTVSSYTSYQNPHPLWQVHAQSHLTRHIKSHPLWQVHAQSHLTRHIKIPPPRQEQGQPHAHITRSKIPTPSGKYMQGHILHVISKSHPLWQVHAQSHLTRHIKIPPPLASTCKVTSYTSYQNPHPSGKYMHSLILHVISNPTPSGKHIQSHILRFIWKSHPLWQAHTKSHLTRHIKIPPPLASTCAVSSYTSYQNPTPSGKYMQSHILHVISKSHPPLASTCTVSSYTSYQNPTPSGKHIQSHILRFIWKSHPLWQAHTKSHLTRHVKIPPPSGKYMHSLILHVISKPHPLWQVQGQPHLTLHDQNPTPSGKYMQGHILHVISKSHPLWQVHAQSHLTRHIKIPPPLASTCAVSSYTSYQIPPPLASTCKVTSLHVISKSHPLWQVHAQSHLTRHIKIPPPLASTCAVSSYTSYQNPTPSGKYTRSLILHIISKSHPLWQVHAQSHLTRHIKIPPPLASTCAVSSYTFTDLGLRNIVYEPCYESWFTNHGLRAMVYESWFTKHSLRAMVYRSRSQPFKAAQRNARVGDLWILHTPGMDQHRRRRHSSEEGGASGDMLGLPFCCQSACLVVVIWFHHVSLCFMFSQFQSCLFFGWRPLLMMTQMGSAHVHVPSPGAQGAACVHLVEPSSFRSQGMPESVCWIKFNLATWSTYKNML